MKILQMILFILALSSPSIAKTDSQFWGNWVAKSSNEYIEITVTENDVFLSLNDQKLKNITYEFYSANSTKRLTKHTTKDEFGKLPDSEH